MLNFIAAAAQAAVFVAVVGENKDSLDTESMILYKNERCSVSNMPA